MNLREVRCELVGGEMWHFNDKCKENRCIASFVFIYFAELSSLVVGPIMKFRQVLVWWIHKSLLYFVLSALGIGLTSLHDAPCLRPVTLGAASDLVVCPGRRLVRGNAGAWDTSIPAVRWPLSPLTNTAEPPPRPTGCISSRATARRAGGRHAARGSRGRLCRVCE